MKSIDEEQLRSDQRQMARLKGRLRPSRSLVSSRKERRKVRRKVRRKDRYDVPLFRDSI